MKEQETYSHKVKRVKNDAINRIEECIKTELDYISKELGIDNNNIYLSIETSEDVMRLVGGKTIASITRNVTMDIKL